MEIFNLDSIDRKILQVLQSNARITIHEMADQIGLSASPIARRIKILEKNGLIKGYAAILDEGKLGYDFSVFVSVQLEKQIDKALVNFEKEIMKLPEVVDCWLMTGNRDYLLRVATSGLNDFEKFLVSHLTKIRGIASIESSIPIRRVKSGLARTPI
jgi:Lrp/AsnC family leucine-responsive transcriptional regulator|tara:strand:+ start:2080 stop:2550 length:471 start_codon:yes stop_codon:yes gene_type:complete